MGEGEVRRLVVLRHAKAVSGVGLPDEDRGLTGRGRRDAGAAGEWLRECGLIPDLVVCSPATRTRETWQHASAALADGGTQVDYDRRLYGASAEGLLRVVRETPAEVGVLLLIGHNPGAQQLVYDLAGECDSFPTAALAVIALPAAWPDAAPGAGDLTAFWTPHPAR